jgi:hypothetical protein
MNKDNLCLFSHHLFLGRAHVGRRQLEPHECILLRHVPFSVVLYLLHSHLHTSVPTLVAPL